MAAGGKLQWWGDGEVHFEGKQRELLWASEFEEVDMFYEHYG